MPATAFVCSRCGEPLPLDVERCPVCRGDVAAAVLPHLDVGPLQSGAPLAGVERRALSSALSILAPVVATAVAAVLASPLGGVATLLIAVATGFVVAAVELVLWMRTGRALGNLATGTRSVRADDATAPSWRVLVPAHRARAASGVDQAPLGRALGVATVVIRPTADPLALSARAIATLPPRTAAPDARDAFAPVVTLVFDGRVRIPLVRSVVIGRNPPSMPGGVAVHSVPDMSRSISKAHVRIDNEGGRVFAQDLGSTNGTELVTADGTTPLQEGARIELRDGAHLLLAGLVLRIESGRAGVTA